MNTQVHKLDSFHSERAGTHVGNTHYNLWAACTCGDVILTSTTRPNTDHAKDIIERHRAKMTPAAMATDPIYVGADKPTGARIGQSDGDPCYRKLDAPWSDVVYDVYPVPTTVSQKSGDPDTIHCEGTLSILGQGAQHTGTAYYWIGCDHCGHLNRKRDQEPTQLSLTDRRSA